MTSTATTLVDARSAFDEGRYEDCLRSIRIQRDAGRVSMEGARLAHDAYMKMGELNRALGEANLLRRLEPSHDHDAMARRLLGRIIETDPRWLPALDSPDRHRSEGNGGQPRVLHILKESLPYVETGFTMRSRMTLEAQKIAGFLPEVITSLGFPRTKGADAFPANELVDGILHHRIDLPEISNPLGLPADVYVTLNARLSAPIATEFGAHVIQAGTGYRGYETALVGIALADQLSLPFVYEVRGFQEATWTSAVERSERGEYYRRRFSQETRCMHRADVVITIAEAMAEEIVDRGIPSEKVSVVPNAVDVDRFIPRPKEADLVEKYALGDRFVVGYISNLGAREGIDHLIAAVGILRSRGLDVCALIAGDGPERRSLDDLISELDLTSRVVMTGHIPNDQIEDHYGLIDLFVVPRVEDRAARLVTPLKPLEAMSMGLPVIASDLPALRELVSPGVRGEVFPPSNAPALAELIADLIADDQTRQRYAEDGQTWVRQNRTVQSNSERYREILGRVLAPVQAKT